MKLVRWLLTVPAGVAGWYAGVVVALLGHAAGEFACPAGQMISGHCAAEWSPWVNHAALVTGALICGALAVLLPALTAPSHRLATARLAYASGIACSMYWVAHGVLLPVACATFAGGLTLWRLARQVAPRPPLA